MYIGVLDVLCFWWSKSKCPKTDLYSVTHGCASIKLNPEKGIKPTNSIQVFCPFPHIFGAAPERRNSPRRTWLKASRLMAAGAVVGAVRGKPKKNTSITLFVLLFNLCLGAFFSPSLPSLVPCRTAAFRYSSGMTLLIQILSDRF